MTVMMMKVFREGRSMERGAGSPGHAHASKLRSIVCQKSGGGKRIAAIFTTRYATARCPTARFASTARGSVNRVVLCIRRPGRRKATANIFNA
jgi:hypothetical protein